MAFFTKLDLCKSKVMLMKSKIILFILFIWLLSPGVTAEEPSVETSIKTDNQEQTTEDITILEMNDLLNLQRQVYRGEDRFFKLFNKLNDDDMYDIHCRMHAPIGTNIKRRECVPEFYDRLTANTAQSFIKRAIHGLDENKRVEFEGTISAGAVIPHHYKILKKRMDELVKANPELYERITELHKLTHKLEEKHRIYYERNAD